MAHTNCGILQSLLLSRYMNRISIFFLHLYHYFDNKLNYYESFQSLLLSFQHNFLRYNKVFLSSAFGRYFLIICIIRLLVQANCPRSLNSGYSQINNIISTGKLASIFVKRPKQSAWYYFKIENNKRILIEWESLQLTSFKLIIEERRMKLLTWCFAILIILKIDS